MTSTPATGPHVLRSMNRRAVLDAIRASAAPIRVTSLSADTGLSRPAVTRALADLIDIGLVERTGTGDASTQLGRPAQRVRFRADLGLVAGADIGPGRVRVAVADLAGQRLASLDIDRPEAGGTGDNLVRAAADAIDRCVRGLSRKPGDLWAIAVGSPGVIDHETGEIRAAPSIPGWAGLPVVQLLRKRFSCPVLIENDTNLAALAERSRGAAADARDFVYVHWDERIGAAIMIGGKPYRGAHSAAGELGFLQLSSGLDGAPDGPGSAVLDGAGAFERQLGTRAIHAYALTRYAAAPTSPLGAALRRTHPDEIGPVLFGPDATGDELAGEVRDRICARFAVGLGALVLLFDPAVVVLGGRMSLAGGPLLEYVRRHLEPRLFAVPELVLSSLGDDAVAAGAVRHALHAVERHLTRLCDGEVA